MSSDRGPTWTTYIVTVRGGGYYRQIEVDDLDEAEYLAITFERGAGSDHVFVDEVRHERTELWDWKRRV